MTKEFICRFQYPDERCTMVVLTGDDLTPEVAERESRKYMKDVDPELVFVTAYDPNED